MTWSGSTTTASTCTSRASTPGWRRGSRGSAGRWAARDKGGTMANPITVDAIVTKLGSARKRTKDATLETVVTLAVTVINPHDDVVARLIAMQGREAVRATFTPIQGALPLVDNGRRKP